MTDVLTASDIAALAKLTDRDADALHDELRRRPWYIHDLLSDPATADALLGSEDGEDGRGHDMVIVSPLLFFAVLVHRSATELSSAQWVADWTGPSSRLPVFDVEPLVAFASRPTRLLHLAELLTSFAMPTNSGLPVPVGVLDLDGLVAWLRSVEPEDQALLLQRMGDVALFLAGVCADRTGDQMLSATDAERLGQSIGMSADDVLALIDPASPTPGLDALEELGSRWYSAAAMQPKCARPSLTFDLARQIRPARRFLNHVADRSLNQSSASLGFGLLG